MAVVDQVVADHVVQAVTQRVPPGEDAAPRRRASRPGDIEIGQPHPFGRQSIEMRRLDGLQAHAAQIGPALVVADDDEDVGTLGGNCVAGVRERCERDQAGETHELASTQY